MHFFDSPFEALATHGIHREESECLREGNAIRTPMQKFNVCVDFPKHCTKDNFPERSLGNGSLH